MWKRKDQVTENSSNDISDCSCLRNTDFHLSSVEELKRENELGNKFNYFVVFFA